ncbi:hypothetical protein NW762_007712 [Fusarium torreyae]|uniref:Uncharacterized protein n=1 Tax=Fusarium torreyae TaxID=1237075 RepID=A0A9W8RZ32_9HYPO|nr:hypothetical protein NW762_007712 [Fusarium torreyae]
MVAGELAGLNPRFLDLNDGEDERNKGLPCFPCFRNEMISTWRRVQRAAEKMAPGPTQREQKNCTYPWFQSRVVPSLMAGNYVDIRATIDAIDRLLNERDKRDGSDGSDENDQSYWLSENCRRGLVKAVTRLGVSFITTVLHHQEIYNLNLNDVNFGQGQADNLLRLGFGDPEFGKYNNACRRFIRDVDWCLKLSRLDERIRNLIIDDLPVKFVQVPQVNMSRARFEGEASETQDE